MRITQRVIHGTSGTPCRRGRVVDWVSVPAGACASACSPKQSWLLSHCAESRSRTDHYRGELPCCTDVTQVDSTFMPRHHRTVFSVPAVRGVQPRTCHHQRRPKAAEKDVGGAAAAALPNVACLFTEVRARREADLADYNNDMRAALKEDAARYSCREATVELAAAARTRDAEAANTETDSVACNVRHGGNLV